MDYQEKGFIYSCIFSGITFLVFKDLYPPHGYYCLGMGFLGYFFNPDLHKRAKEEGYSYARETFIALFFAIISLWVPLVLSFIWK